MTGSFHVFRGNHGYEFAVIPVSQTSACGGVPKVEGLRFAEVGETLAVGKMRFEEIRQGGQHIALEFSDLQITRWLVIRQPVVTFPVVGAATVGILPAESFVDVVGGERGGGPVVSVRAGFGIDEEAVKQTETLRERTVVGRHGLPRAVRPLRGNATAENGQGGLAIGGVPIAGSFHIAEHLIIGTILLDDVDHVLDRTGSCKKLRRSRIHQAVILHGLLRVARQRRAVRQRDGADVSRNNRAAVLTALAIFLFVRRKRGVGRIRSAAAIVRAHR